MNIEQRVDRELLAGFRQLPPIIARPPVEARAFLKEFLLALNADSPSGDRVHVADRLIPGSAGAPDIAIRIYQPAIRKGSLPGVLYIHGGGFRIGDLDTEDHDCRHIIEQVLDCIVVSVNYRLAPENPFPAPLDDCYTALKWMTNHGEELNLDLSRLAIRGASAGGGICAALALLARDRQEIQLTFQQILYGCLDDRHLTPSSYEITDPRIWNRQLSLEGWKAYLGTEQGGETSPYAAPARMDDLSNLPHTYIMVGELDLLRDEIITYAQRLMQARVPTELHVYPGCFHGFEATMPTATISKHAKAEIDAALKHALNG